jgi:acetyl-CoA carboxylase biotin carboxyl carrier protein
MAKKKKSAAPKSAPKAKSGGGGFTDLDRVKSLVDLMSANGLSEIELAEADKKIILRRGTTSAVAHQVVHAPVHAPVAPIHAPQTSAPTVSAPAKNEDEGLIAIKSPMVGTFYAAASPDAEPFGKVGMNVTPKTTVCIIEAMKVFNEIPAEVSGTIAKVLITNGQPVEFGQALFMVKPS